MNLDLIFNYLYKLVPKETQSWLANDVQKWLTCIDINDDIKFIFSTLMVLNY